MLANPTPMQQALFKAAASHGTKQMQRAVLKAADRIKVTEPQGNIKLSYRTAMKLKQEGVIV